jgi:hypothetical protein
VLLILVAAWPALGQTPADYLPELRQADALADAGELSQANAIYSRIATTAGVPRQILIEAAIGLYRTGAFRDSLTAFAALGELAKGEEDLRFYTAVALFETGAYLDAEKQLACALPFIQMTEEVSRYRIKIEETARLRRERR